MPHHDTVTAGSIIVFDLDGTLVDSAPDLVGTLNKVIATQGLPAIPNEQVGHLVGQGALKMLDKAYAYCDTPLDEALRGRLLKDFLDIYVEHMADESRPFEGVIDSLDTLKREGWILAVCTNKYEAMAVKLLKLLKLDGYFAAICGSDTFPVKKPDPAHLFGTIDRAKGDKAKAIMVGDSTTDINTAKAAHIPAIGVTFGYSDVPMQSLEPTEIIEHYSEFMDAVGRIHKNFE